VLLDVLVVGYLSLKAHHKLFTIVYEIRRLRAVVALR